MFKKANKNRNTLQYRIAPKCRDGIDSEDKHVDPELVIRLVIGNNGDLRLGTIARFAVRLFLFVCFVFIKVAKKSSNLATDSSWQHFSSS